MLHTYIHTHTHTHTLFSSSSSLLVSSSCDSRLCFAFVSELILLSAFSNCAVNSVFSAWVLFLKLLKSVTIASCSANCNTKYMIYAIAFVYNTFALVSANCSSAALSFFSNMALLFCSSSNWVAKSSCSEDNAPRSFSNLIMNSNSTWKCDKDTILLGFCLL